MEYTIFISPASPPLLPCIGDWRQMDDAPDGGHHRYHGIGCGSRIELRHCLAVFLRSASGGRTFATLMPYNVTWLPFTSTLSIDLGILLDPISVMMLIVISTVSLMVHVYSFGYMKGERGFQRYYAFLSLFTMSMLGLVVATNIFQMYLFWELVGVSSYLLIGFYYTKRLLLLQARKRSSLPVLPTWVS